MAALTAEQHEVQATARRIANSVLRANAEQIDLERRYPAEELKAPCRRRPFGDSGAHRLWRPRR